MASYFTLRSDIQTYDRRLENLTDEANRLHDFCLFYVGRTMVGVRRFTIRDVLARFPHWDEAICHKALNELEEVGLVIHDPTNRVLYATMTFDHAPILGRGIKMVKGACNKLAEFPDSPVLIPALKHVLNALEDVIARSTESAKAELDQRRRTMLERLDRLKSSNREAP